MYSCLCQCVKRPYTIKHAYSNSMHPWYTIQHSYSIQRTAYSIQHTQHTEYTIHHTPHTIHHTIYTMQMLSLLLPRSTLWDTLLILYLMNLILCVWCIVSDEPDIVCMVHCVFVWCFVIGVWCMLYGLWCCLVYGYSV